MENKKCEERRESLLNHAGNVFAAKGFAATKIADIARTAGISQGLMYRYFPSKEALFSELIRNSFAKLNEAAIGLERLPLPPDAKVALALRELIGGMATSSTFPNRVLLIAQASLSEGLPAEVKTILTTEAPKPYAVIARIMAEGQRAGTLLPGEPAELAALFWTTIKGLALHKVAQGEAFRPPALKIIGRLFFPDERVWASLPNPASEPLA